MKLPLRVLSMVVLLSVVGTAARADEPMIAEVRMFAGNFAPRGWALCNGQMMAIKDNTALFSLIGTTYGGNGRTTFALPDLRGRVPVHPGSGSGLTPIRLGDKRGTEKVTTKTTVASAATTGAKMVTVAKGGQAVPIMQPCLGVNFIIALRGTYPSRK